MAKWRHTKPPKPPPQTPDEISSDTNQMTQLMTWHLRHLGDLRHLSCLARHDNPPEARQFFRRPGLCCATAPSASLPLPTLASSPESCIVESCVLRRAEHPPRSSQHSLRLAAQPARRPSSAISFLSVSSRGGLVAELRRALLPNAAAEEPADARARAPKPPPARRNHRRARIPATRRCAQQLRDRGASPLGEKRTSREARLPACPSSLSSYLQHIRHSPVTTSMPWPFAVCRKKRV